MTKPIELWDAYDKQMNRIEGVELVRGQSIPAGIYHLVVEIAVRHSDGSWLLMRRHPDKTLGNRWELSAGGSAICGETAYEAAKRELFEETGIEAENMTELGRLINHNNHSIYVEYLASVDCNKAKISLQAGETIDYMWIAAKEFATIPKNELATIRIQSFIPELRE